MLEIGKNKPKDTLRSDRAYPTISKALNATLKDFFFVDEEDEESRFFDGLEDMDH